jgi:hypothetical protein
MKLFDYHTSDSGERKPFWKYLTWVVIAMIIMPGIVLLVLKYYVHSEQRLIRTIPIARFG